jgi:hypothetical protein
MLSACSRSSFSFPAARMRDPSYFPFSVSNHQAPFSCFHHHSRSSFSRACNLSGAASNLPCSGGVIHTGRARVSVRAHPELSGSWSLCYEQQRLIGIQRILPCSLCNRHSIQSCSTYSVSVFNWNIEERQSITECSVLLDKYQSTGAVYTWLLCRLD